MAEPLAGDELTTALIPVADRLISAVHAVDPTRVAQALADAATLAGPDADYAQHWAVLQGLALLLAAWCSEDHAAPAALGWTVNPAEYHRLRSSADALTASLRAGRTTTEQGGA
jgi:hypothetical protein